MKFKAGDTVLSTIPEGETDLLNCVGITIGMTGTNWEIDFLNKGFEGHEGSSEKLICSRWICCEIDLIKLIKIKRRDSNT